MAVAAAVAHPPSHPHSNTWYGLAHLYHQEESSHHRIRISDTQNKGNFYVTMYCSFHILHTPATKCAR